MGCKKLPGFLLATLLCANLQAQIKLTGTVRDGANAALEFAIIRLERDSADIKTTLSDTAGSFIILEIPQGSYKLSAHALGFTPVLISLKLSSDTIIEIRFTDKGQELKEVVIQSSTGTLERKADRFVYSIANKESSKGASVLEALQQAPLMQVDEASNAIKLLNKPNTVIYINGRRSYLSPEALMNLLKNSPAENVIRVEMITTPGSEYQVDGNAGVINIVMKRNLSDSYNGSARISNTYSNSLSPGAFSTFNLRRKKLGISVTGYFNHNQSRDLFSKNIHFLELSKTQEVDSYRKRSVIFTGPSLNLDYDLSSRQTLGFMGDYNISNEWNDEFNSISRYFTNGSGQSDSVQKTFQSGKSKGRNIALNGNYQILIDTVGSKLNIDIDYSAYSDAKTTFTDIDLYDGDNHFLFARQRTKQVVPQEFLNWSSRIELIAICRKKNSLKAGAQTSFTTTDNDTYFGNKSGTDYFMDSQRTYHYQYSEQIYSGFMMLERRWNDKWQSSIGIRTEITRNEGQEIRTDSGFVNRDINLLPFISLAYAPYTKHQFSLTFSDRMKRPAFWELNPFRIYNATNIYIENNPFLKSERLYIGELAYVFKEKYTFLLGYSQTLDAYSQFALVDTPNTIKLVRLNYGTEEEASITFTTQQELFKGVLQSNLTITGSISRYIGKAEYVQFDRGGYDLFATCNNTLHLSRTRKWIMLVNLSYNSPTNWYYGKGASTHSIMLGIRKKWNSTTLVIRIYDLTKGKKLRYWENDSRAETRGIINYDTRFIQVAFGYTFGSKNLKGARNRETSNTEWKDRTQK